MASTMFDKIWGRHVVTEGPAVKDGYIYPLTGPGLGTKLLPDLPKREGVQVRCSR